MTINAGVHLCPGLSRPRAKSSDRPGHSWTAGVPRAFPGTPTANAVGPQALYARACLAAASEPRQLTGSARGNSVGCPTREVSCSGRSISCAIARLSVGRTVVPLGASERAGRTRRKRNGYNTSAWTGWDPRVRWAVPASDQGMGRSIGWRSPCGTALDSFGRRHGHDCARATRGCSRSRRRRSSRRAGGC
jgi:hypothetical protein